MEKEENEIIMNIVLLPNSKKNNKTLKFYLFSRVTQESFTIEPYSLLVFFNDNSKRLFKKVIENIKKI